MRDTRQDGLFVAVRADGEHGEGQAAVLKLQVVAPHTGYLWRTRGRVRLGAVRDALNTPGQLQKGALYPDHRIDSAVVVGDQMDIAALYFLSAVGLTQDQSPKAAVAVLYDSARARAPGAELAIAESIARRRPETVADALDALTQDVPELAPSRGQIEQELRGQKRPPVALDPDRASGLRRVISGHGISIEGSVGTMRDRLEGPHRTDDGRWQVMVTFDTEPSDRVRA